MTVPPLVVASAPTARSSVSPVTVAPALRGSPCGAARAAAGVVRPADAGIEAGAGEGGPIGGRGAARAGAGGCRRADAGIEADASEAAPIVRRAAARTAVTAARSRGRMARGLDGLVGGPPAYCVGMSAAPSLHWAGKA